MIRLDEVSRTYTSGASTLRALDNLSIEIASGEFVILVGPNGSGKSTLLGLIAGSVSPDAGRIMIGDEEVTRQPEERRARRVGRIFQNPFAGTAPSMTVAENLRLAALRGRRRGLRRGLDGAEIELYRERLIPLGLGLEERLETPVGLLSGGQRQALTLLMATLRPPDVLLLDEPTAALDPGSAETVLGLGERLIREQRLTALMVTHDLEQAVRFGDRLLIMRAGRIDRDISGGERRSLREGDLISLFRGH